MYNLDYSDYHSLAELNESLQAYIHEKNRTLNRSIDQTPFERFTQDTAPIKKVDVEKLEQAFLHTVIRKVANDGTIQLNTRQYETGYLTIAQKVTLRYLPDMSKVYHQTEDGQLFLLNQVNKVENSQIKRQQVRLTEE